MLKAVARIGCKVGKGQLRAAGKRVALANEDVDRRVEEGMEACAGIGEGLLQNAGVKVVQIEDADIAAKCADVIDDLRCGGLAHDELELAVAAALDHVDKGLDRKGVVLGGNGEAGLRGAAVLVARLEHVGLLYDLARIAQKLGAVVGERDAAAGARKDLQVELLFQAFDGV